jgi:hypothetical protein
MKLFKTILPLFLIIIGIYSSILIFVVIVLLYLFFLFFSERQVLYRLKNKYFLSFVFVLVFVYPLFGESNDIKIFSKITYDLNYLEMSIKMCLRAILLFAFSNFLLINISTNHILSKFKVENSDRIIYLAMDNYENIAKKTLYYFKNLKLKKLKLAKFVDYAAIFMADLLSQNLSDCNVSHIEEENI